MNYYEQRLNEINMHIHALQQHSQPQKTQSTIQQLKTERKQILQRIKYME